MLSGTFLSEAAPRCSALGTCCCLPPVEEPVASRVRGLEIVSLVVTDDDYDDKLDGVLTNQRAAMCRADQSEALCTEVTGAVLILGG